MKHLVVCLLILLCVSCTVNRLPQAAPGVKVDGTTLVFTQQNILVKLSLPGWNREPRDLEDLYTPLYVDLSNGGKEVQDITTGDFCLLNSANYQFDPISTDEVLANYDKPPQPNPDKFNRAVNPPPADNYQQIRKNVLEKSLVFGKLLPGARKSGYIFFTRQSWDEDSLSVDFRGKMVVFKRVEKKLF